MAAEADATRLQTQVSVVDDVTPTFPGPHETSDETPDEAVCKSGDVILLADDGFHPALKITVSSSLLSLASKVFKALFSAKFAEGQAMRNAGNALVEIRMSDPPADLLLLCQLLHFRGDIESTTHQQFLGLAVIIDKYDCVKPLRHATKSRFAMINLKCIDQDESIYFATAAYILDDSKFFRAMTRCLVVNYIDGFPKLKDSRLDALPSEVLPSIQAQRAFAHRELTYHLSKFIAKYHTAALALGASGHSNEITQIMLDLDLWPLDPRFLDLEWAFDNLREYHVPIMKADDLGDDEDDKTSTTSNEQVAASATSVYRLRLSPKTKAIKPPTKFDLTLIVERIESFCVGMCLDCLKGQDECRVEHTDPFEEAWFTPFRHMGYGGNADYNKDTERPKDWHSAW